MTKIEMEKEFVEFALRDYKNVKIFTNSKEESAWYKQFRDYSFYAVSLLVGYEKEEEKLTKLLHNFYITKLLFCYETNDRDYDLYLMYSSEIRVYIPVGIATKIIDKNNIIDSLKNIVELTHNSNSTKFIRKEYKNRYISELMELLEKELESEE